MSKGRNLIMSVLAVAVVLGATPAFAQWWVGDWRGEGTGLCDDGYTKMYPWHTWKGEILAATPGVFKGEWEDVITSTFGTFYMEYMGSGVNFVDFAGYWQWYDGSGNLIYGGPAKMTFYNATSDYCEGAWDAVSFPYDPTPRIMKGERY